MRKAFIPFAALLIFLLLQFNANADSGVVISGFYALGGSGQDSDWVEIYNSSTQAQDLSGYLIKDETETNKIELNGFICPQDFRRFTFSNRLNNSGDKIRLFNENSNLLEEVTYFSQTVPTHLVGQSTKKPNPEIATWQLQEEPDLQDNLSCNPQPTPTPSEQNISSPTPSPASSSSQTKKSSPTPSPKSTPKPTVAPSPQSDVLGTKDKEQIPLNLKEEEKPSPSPTLVPNSYKSYVFKNLSLIMIGVGLVFVGISTGTYLWYKRSLKSNINNETLEKLEDRTKNTF